MQGLDWSVNFTYDIGRQIAKIDSDFERVGKSTAKANKKLDGFEKAFKDIDGAAKKFQQTTGKAHQKNEREAGKSEKATENLTDAFERLKNHPKAEAEGRWKNFTGSISRHFKGVADAASRHFQSVTFSINETLELSSRLSEGLAFATDIRGLTTEIQRFGSVTGPELEMAGQKAFQLQEVYGESGRQIVQAANAMSKQLGGSFLKNLDLIEQGFAKGANLNEDLLDQLREYGPQLKQAGITAEQGIALMAESAKAGIWSDKGVDAVKEATLSLREFDKAQREALAGVGIMAKDLKGKTIIEQIQLISKAMKGAGEQARAKVIADIFKGAGEDAGESFILGLADMQFDLTKHESFQQANQQYTSWLASVKATVAGTIGGFSAYLPVISSISVASIALLPILKGVVATTGLQAVATTALTKAKGSFLVFQVRYLVFSAKEWALDKLKAAGKGIVTAAQWAYTSAKNSSLVVNMKYLALQVKDIALQKLSAAWSGVVTAATWAWIAAKSAWNTAGLVGMAILTKDIALKTVGTVGLGLITAAQWAWNAAMTANPLGIVIALIGGLIGAVVWAWNEFEGFRGTVAGLWESFKALNAIIFDGFIAVIKSAWEVVKSFLGKMWDGITNVIDGISSAFGGLKKIVLSALSFDWDGVSEGVDELGDGVRQAGAGMMDAIPVTNLVKNFGEYGQVAAGTFKENFDHDLQSIANDVTGAYNRGYDSQRDPEGATEDNAGNATLPSPVEVPDLKINGPLIEDPAAMPELWQQPAVPGQAMPEPKIEGIAKVQKPAVTSSGGGSAPSGGTKEGAKHINVSIGQLVREIKIMHHGEYTKGELKRLIAEELTDAVRDFEATI